MTTVALGDITKARSSLVDPIDSRYCSEPHIGPDSIERDTGRLLQYRTVSEDGVTSGKYRFEAGDILYSKIRPNLNKVVLVDFSGLCSADMYALDVDRTRAIPEYLAHLMRSDWFVSYATSKSGRANIPKINRVALMALEFDLPPLEEQRRIAAILDRAEDVCAIRARQASVSRLLPQSIFASIVGSPESIMSAWPCKRLDDLLAFMTSGSRGWARYYVDEGDLFLRIQNVRNDELVLDDVAMVDAPNSAEARRTKVEPGDVLLSITADLGRTAVVPDGLGSTFINQHLSILRTSLVPAYLSAFLSSPVGQAQILRRNRQGVKAGLNFEDIRSFEIPVPPHEIQQSFQVARWKAQDISRSVRKGQSEVDAFCRATSRRLFAVGAG